MRLAHSAVSTALLVVAAAVACGNNACSSSTRSASSSCGYSGAIPTIPASPVTAQDVQSQELPSGVSVQAYAEAQAYRYLDSFVGQYLRGDVTIYAGTLSAHDNESVLGTDCAGGTACKDQSISEGPAVASLTVVEGVASLTVHSLAEHKYVMFQQTKEAADVTTVSLVLSDTTSGGNSGTCSGCVPSFASKPQTISFQNIESTVDVGVNAPPVGEDAGSRDAGGAMLNTYASSSLTLGTACALTFDDLVELNALNPPSGLNAPVFTLEGGEMVAELRGSIYGNVSNQYCLTSYTIEIYVNASNLAAYGVRGYQTYVPDAGYYYGSVCPQ